MRKFIVSDLHGNGNIYDSIMAYLNNLSEELTLYINGDLIDRGEDSARMLMDVFDRINNNKGFKIEYLAGNHELMMYQASLSMKNNEWPNHTDWFCGNGGNITAHKLDEIISKSEKLKLIDFISNLKIYHKFDETINNKNIVLVHAKCPEIVKDECDLKICDNNLIIDRLLWSRKNDPTISFYKQNLGNLNYFTIIGHTPINDKYGFYYDKYDNTINIDGGCAAYVNGYLEYNHTPLIEIEKDKLIILTFNNNNEIIYGNYFIDNKIVNIPDDYLDEYRKNLNKKKIKLK